MQMPSDRESEPYELLGDVSVGSPHVVILGAGASRAACLNGDASGKKLPLMDDLADAIGVADELYGSGQPSNFEELYSSLVADPTRQKEVVRLESAIRDFFEGLRLPEATTIYDHLVLGLRDKDVIATFNWDPFLVQAVQRSHLIGARPPELVFLHGNVALGHCHEDKRFGPVHSRCGGCGRPYIPSRLLYPVAEKNYTSDEGIAEAWRFLRESLRRAFMVTIFGYSAPASDCDAIELLRGAWGEPTERALEQIEFIDIRDEDELRSTWSDFIHTHHYEVHTDFHESTIALHPRRTGEAFRQQYINGEWVRPNPIPKDIALSELVSWYSPLHARES